jgi:hypothetical protein
MSEYSIVILVFFSLMTASGAASLPVRAPSCLEVSPWHSLLP